MMKYLKRKKMVEETPQVDDDVILEHKKSDNDDLMSTMSTKEPKYEVQNENDDMKPTFVRPPVNRVSERISMFRKYEDNDGMCVLGSGRCAYHNVRLVRSVVTRKGSVQGGTGVRWERLDSTVLICPGARQQREKERLCDNDSMTDRAKSQLSSGGTTTNKRRKFFNDIEYNQSLPGSQEGEPAEQFSLDDDFKD